MVSILNQFKYVYTQISKLNHNQRLLPSESIRIHQSRTMWNDKESCDIVWMDLEMTGLDIEKDKIMELSCIITDKELNIISEELSFAVKQPKSVLDNMNEWCIKHHNESGLVENCLKSDISIAQAESIVFEFLKKHIPERKCPLAGNSIYMDRIFLKKHMPLVHEYLHYRIIDVSTIKELARRWNTEVFKGAPKKKFKHRSLDDIKDSIEELKFYRTNFFK